MSSTPEVPIALIDDHTLVRKGLVELIEHAGGYRVVLEAGNGREFIHALTEGPHVELAIVDLNMPVMDGYDTLAWLVDNRPDIRALALTFDGTEDALIKAICSGARGFILKDIEPAELKIALDQVATTGYYHTDLIHHGMMESREKKIGHERRQERVLEEISAREMEFLKLVCLPEELTYERIGELMHVHRRTVDGYREALFEKFGIRSKTGLVLFAMKWGIIKP